MSLFGSGSRAGDLGKCKHSTLAYLRGSEFAKGNWTCVNCAVIVAPQRGSENPTYKKTEIATLKFQKWLHSSGRCGCGCEVSESVVASK